MGALPGFTCPACEYEQINAWKDPSSGIQRHTMLGANLSVRFFFGGA